MPRRTSSTTRPAEPPSLLDRTRRPDPSRSPRGDRSATATTRLGPYEAQYDISLGYGSDRSVTVQ